MTAAQRDAEEKSYYESPIKDIHQSVQDDAGRYTDIGTGGYKAVADYAKDIAWREKQDDKLYERDRFKKFSKLNNVTYDYRGYIQNQDQLDDISYGTKGTGADSSCGSIATYNACVDMGIDVDFKDVYNHFSENGALFGGRAGTNPVKAVEFLNDRPEVKDVTIYTDEEDLGKHDSYILLYGGKFDGYIFEPENYEFHYQQFNIDGSGKIIMSNGVVEKASIDTYLDGRFKKRDAYMIIGIDKDETYGLTGMMNPNGFSPNTSM